MSFAPADAEVARRIAEGLRSAGADVVLGDAGPGGEASGEATMREQIRTCALFVAVVSANAQALPAGAFRRAWQLAAARARAEAEARSFLLPVVVDGTREESADVPVEYREVVWGRLPDGNVDAAFRARVEAALSGLAPVGASGDSPSIPDYTLLRRIGAGGYGEVWLARGMTGVYRAVKIVWRARFAEAGPFEREYRGLTEAMRAAVGEGGELAVLHAGRDPRAGFFYYVMELADDAERCREFDPIRYVPLTLKELAKRRGRLPVAECAAIGAALAGVLARMHARGVVHRDIKPANVVFVGGVAKLADIGLVARAGDAPTAVGTEGYMPPEGPGRPDADVFALGKVLYELATGFDRREFPKLPEDLVPGEASRALFALNGLLLRACAVNPTKRPRDGAVMLRELQALGAGGRKRRSGALFAAAVASAVALAAAYFWRPGIPSAPAAPTGEAAQPVASKKSLVVLPLENLSSDPKNAFFAEGMHAEIIATLARTADLKVTARTTARAVAGAGLSVAEIARRLGVTTVLSGSVRREGRNVRVQLELRRAADEEVLWQKTFDREFRDGFALQDEIAAEVARVLQARERSGTHAGARFMTKNPRAYELFLRAREIPETKGSTPAGLREQVRLCEEALALDPEFMSAASVLSTAYCYLLTGDLSADVRASYAAAAKHWAERAAELVPGGAGDGASAAYYGMVESDPERALKYAENEVRALPNDPNGLNRLARSLSLFGRMAEAVATTERALALDPLHAKALLNQVFYLGALRRVQAFEDAVAQSIASGGFYVDPLVFTDLRFRLSGRLPTAAEEAGLMPEVRLLVAWYGRRFGEVAAMTEQPPNAAKAIGLAFHLMQRRYRVAALERLGSVEPAAEAKREFREFADRQQGAAETGSSVKERARLWAMACNDEAEAAIALGRRLVRATAAPAQTEARWAHETDLALIYARFGRAKECVAVLKELLRAPTGITVPYLRLAPEWDPVRDDPGFRALLDDPKNSLPL